MKRVKKSKNITSFKKPQSMKTVEKSKNISSFKKPQSMETVEQELSKKETEMKFENEPTCYLNSDSVLNPTTDEHRRINELLYKLYGALVKEKSGNYADLERFFSGGYDPRKCMHDDKYILQLKDDLFTEGLSGEEIYNELVKQFASKFSEIEFTGVLTRRLPGNIDVFSVRVQNVSGEHFLYFWKIEGFINGDVLSDFPTDYNSELMAATIAYYWNQVAIIIKDCIDEYSQDN